MKDFRVEAVAQTEFEEAAGYYEAQRDGLGFEFIEEIDRVLARIAHQEHACGGCAEGLLSRVPPVPSFDA